MAEQVPPRMTPDEIRAAMTANLIRRGESARRFRRAMGVTALLFAIWLATCSISTQWLH